MLTLNQVKFRFTSDGKVPVMDIVAALCATDTPEMIREEITLQDTKIYGFCEDFSFKDDVIYLADKKVFQMVEKNLFHYLVHQWQEAV